MSRAATRRTRRSRTAAALVGRTRTVWGPGAQRGLDRPEASGEPQPAGRRGGDGQRRVEGAQLTTREPEGDAVLKDRAHTLTDGPTAADRRTRRVTRGGRCGCRRRRRRRDRRRRGLRRRGRRRLLIAGLLRPELPLARDGHRQRRGLRDVGAQAGGALKRDGERLGTLEGPVLLDGHLDDPRALVAWGPGERATGRLVVHVVGRRPLRRREDDVDLVVVVAEPVDDERRGPALHAARVRDALDGEAHRRGPEDGQAEERGHPVADGSEVGGGARGRVDRVEPALVRAVVIVASRVPDGVISKPMFWLTFVPMPSEPTSVRTPVLGDGFPSSPPCSISLPLAESTS